MIFNVELKTQTGITIYQLQFYLLDSVCFSGVHLEGREGRQEFNWVVLHTVLGSHYTISCTPRGVCLSNALKSQSRNLLQKKKKKNSARWVLRNQNCSCKPTEDWYCEIDTVSILLRLHWELHSIKLSGVELPVCAKLLQVKPDDKLHTMPVVFSVTDLVTLLLSSCTRCVNLVFHLLKLLALTKVLKSQLVYLSVLSVEKDLMWLCHFCADHIVDVCDDSSELLQSLLDCIVSCIVSFSIFSVVINDKTIKFAFYNSVISRFPSVNVNI